VRNHDELPISTSQFKSGQNSQRNYYIDRKYQLTSQNYPESSAPFSYTENNGAFQGNNQVSHWEVSNGWLNTITNKSQKPSFAGTDYDLETNKINKMLENDRYGKSNYHIKESSKDTIPDHPQENQIEKVVKVRNKRKR